MRSAQKVSCEYLGEKKIFLLKKLSLKFTEHEQWINVSLSSPIFTKINMNDKIYCIDAFRRAY